MEDMWNRIGEYRKHSRAYDRQNINLFKAQIKLGRYPPKCLACYIMGINNCIWWEKKFECEETQIKTIEEAALQFQ